MKNWLPAFLVFLFSSISSFGQLSGTYTIGGSNPDYTTILAAASDLKTKGINGPVIFKIRAGTYNTSVRFDSCSGQSAVNTITLTHDTVGGNKVVIQNHSTPIELFNNRYFIIKGLEIVSLGNSAAISFKGQNNHIVIRKNIIWGPNTLTTTNWEACIYSPNNSGNFTNYLQIDSNNFFRGSAMVYVSGANDSSRAKEVIITNNVHDSAGTNGIRVYYSDSVLVSGNSISDEKTKINRLGIQVSRSRKVQISSNALFQFNRNGSIGISFMNGRDPIGYQPIVANNYIFQPNAGSGYYQINVDNVLVANNTIRSKGNYPSSVAVLTSGGSINLVNNNLALDSIGKLIYNRDTTRFIKSNRNNLFTGFGKIGRFNGRDLISFQNWKDSTQLDSLSLNKNPLWISKTDPIPGHGLLDSSGRTEPRAPKDLNGTTRNSIYCDIGCTEFSPLTRDIGVIEFASKEFCPGSNPIKVRFVNSSSSVITSFKVNWFIKKDSGLFIRQPKLNFVGTLPPYTDTVISLKNLTLASDTLYAIKCVVDSVNGAKDLNSNNDTLVSSFFQTRMIGTYTVGKSNSSFKTLRDVLNEINKRGICGPVIIDIEPDHYIGPHTLLDIKGSSRTNIITIRTKPNSNSRAKIKANGGANVTLKSTKYVNFEDLIIESSQINHAVTLAFSTENISFTNVSFYGTKNSNSILRSCVYGYGSSSTNIRNISFKKCSFYNGYCGIYLWGRGSPTPYFQSGITIDSCEILDSYRAGVILTYSRQSSITNTIIRTNKSTLSKGIELFETDSLSVNGNKIIYTGSAGIYGNKLNSTANNPSVTIRNNMVSYHPIQQNLKTSGIELKQSTGIDIAFNSVLVKGTNATSAALVCNPATSLIRNNILLNRGTGYAAIYDSSSTNSRVNHNNLWSNGTFIGHLGSPISTFLLWKSVLKADSSSTQLNPDFVSDHDLHLVGRKLLNTGTPISSISTDFDGDTRNIFAPDVGADEHQQYRWDAAVVNLDLADSICPGLVSSQFRFRNLGDSVIRSLEYSIKVDSMGFNKYSSRDSITGNWSLYDSINLAKYIPFYSSGALYRVSIKIDKVNGLPDQYRVNDSLIKFIYVSAVPSVFRTSTPKPCANDHVIKLNYLQTTDTIQYFGLGIVNNGLDPRKISGQWARFTVVVGDTSSCGIAFKDSIEIKIAPEIKLYAPPTVCHNSPAVHLSFARPYGGVYTGQYITGNTFEAYKAQPGNYSVQYKLAWSNGCMDSAQSVISKRNSPITSIDTTIGVCLNNKAVKLNSAQPPGGVYYGNFVHSSSAEFIPPPDSIGIFKYFYRYRDFRGCRDTVEAFIQIHPNPQIHLPSDTIYCGEQTLNLTSGLSSVQHEWSTGSTSDTLQLNREAGKFWVKVTDSNSCTSSDTILVYFKPNCWPLAFQEKNITIYAKYYPNPSSGKIVVEIIGVEGQIRLSVRNMAGQEVKHFQWLSHQEFKESIDLSTQPNGIYFFDLQTPLGRSIERVTISK